jgi:hypothetical protein
MGLQDVQRRYAEYVAFAKAKGHSMMAYKVPCCGQTVEGRMAPTGRLWDCLCTCPHCGKMYTKITTADSVVGKLPEAA